jgi:hypothetical protein
MGKLPVQSKVRALAVPERDVKRAVLAHFVGRPDVIIWNHPTGFDPERRIRYGLVGSADLIGCYRGRFLAIECKSARGVMSKEQKAFRAAVERIGGMYIVARSVEDVAHL